MEDTTVFIYRSQNEESTLQSNNIYRIVTFIDGNRDIMEIIKEIIKDKTI